MDLLEVRPFQETLNAGMCGPASLKMVLAYWGIEKSERELAELSGTKSDLGTSGEDMQRVAESFGLNVEVKNLATFDDIRGWLDKKVPVIVNWFTRGHADSSVPDGHYSVVVGLDDESIYIQDPEIGELRTLKKEDFMKVWFDFKGEIITSWNDMIIRQVIAVYRP